MRQAKSIAQSERFSSCVRQVQQFRSRQSGCWAWHFGARCAGRAWNGNDIADNLAFQPGAFYLTYLNPAGATNVTGTASLAGAVEAVFAPGAYGSKSYDILHSGGLGGSTFSGLTVVPSNIDASPSYSTTDVFLNLTAQLGQWTNLNVNQQNVANALNSFFQYWQRVAA